MMRKETYNFCVLLLFSIFMSIFAITGIGIIPLTEYISIDLLIIPVIIFSLTTSSKISIINGIIWGLVVVLITSSDLGYSIILAGLTTRMMVSYFSFKIFSILSKERYMIMLYRILLTLVFSIIINTSLIYLFYKGIGVYPISPSLLLFKGSLELLGCIFVILLTKKLFKIVYHHNNIEDIRIKLGRGLNLKDTGFYEEIIPCTSTDNNNVSVRVLKESGLQTILIQVPEDEFKDRVAVLNLEGSNKVCYSIIPSSIEDSILLISKDTFDQLNISPKRRDIRLNVTDSVLYKLFNSEEFKEGKLLNISPGGLKLKIPESPTEADKGKSIQLSFRNSQLPIDNIVEGKITRCKKIQGDGNNLGIVFIHLEEDDQISLLNWIVDNQEDTQLTKEEL